MLKIFKFSVLLATVHFNFPAFAVGTAPQAEVQWSICEGSPQVFLNKADEEFEEKSSRSISFLESSDLFYLAHGVIFRMISKNEEGSVKIKSTIKIDINENSTIDWQWLSLQEHKCEINIYHGKESYSCSMDNKDAADQSFNDKQIEMVRKVGGIEFDASHFKNMKVFGPLKLNKWSSKKTDLSFESVDIPGSEPIMELSIRVPDAEKYQIQKKYDLWIQEKGIHLCERQSSRTEVLLKSTPP
jgi:hypothetical protein